jgi:twinkle protein
VKQDGQQFTVTKDDHDWLMDLGKKHGVTRIMPSTTAEHLVEQFRPPLSDGLSLPWEGVNDYVRFMPRRVSVWSGPTFSGKTAFLRQLMLHAASNNHRCCFISLEEETDDVWREFIMMASCTRSPNKHQRQWAIDWMENKIWVFDSTEAIDPVILMGIIRFACDKFGFSHIVIDSLMRLNLALDDYEGQREMGNMLGRLARLTSAHIHLVAHPRKTASSRAPMDLYDIRGAQDIVAQADLVLTLERKHGELHTNELKCWKQRGDSNWIGTVPLWYDKDSRQLKARQLEGPIRYLPSDAYSPVVPFVERA